MNREEVMTWVALYERLWRTAGTGELGEAFAEGVVYSMSPYEEPVRGLDALRELWERERFSPDEEFEMSAEPVAVEDDTAVVRAEVAYGPPRSLEYRDLWVIRFDSEGRCESFEEWPYWPGREPLPEVER